MQVRITFYFAQILHVMLTIIHICRGPSLFTLFLSSRVPTDTHRVLSIWRKALRETLKPATGTDQYESTAGAAATLAAASAAAKASGHTSQYGSTPWTGTLESISATVAAASGSGAANAPSKASEVVEAAAAAPSKDALASAAATLGLSVNNNDPD